LLLCSALLAGCGGGARSVAPKPASTAAAAYNGALADATFKITIPVPTASVKARRPAYVSSSTTKILFTLNSDTVGLTGAALATFNTTNLGAKAVTLNSATCPGSGPWTCTLALKLPPGTDNLTISAQDASSNILSQQVQDFTVVAATANSFSTTLDANAATISLSGTQACTSGAIGSSFGSAGTTPVVLNVSYTDLAGQPIIAPGLPNLQVQANHGGDTAYHNNSGTIDGTGGSVGFSIDQNAQTITLTPSTTPVSNVTVNVKAIPPSTDGLSFAQTKTFTFAAGDAPPAHNFLAVVEQNGAGTAGQINLFTVALGGSGAADTLTPYAPAPTLATTTSINAAPDGQQPDVDFPEHVTFDSLGSLLIANGGQGGAGGDYGNFACVPPGAISTGLALATTNRTGLRVPTVIALSSNGTVALGNNPAGATTKVQEFNLGTNYVTGSSYPDDGTNTYGVPLGRPLVNLPTLTAGTFAFGLFNGTHSKVVVMGSTGTTSTITDSTDSHLQFPYGMAWDPAQSQLIVANNDSYLSYLTFYTVSNPPGAITNVNSFRLQPDPDPADDCPGGNPCSGMLGQRVAVAPTSGTIAVSGLNFYNSVYAGIEIQLYDTNRNPIGVIPFDTANSAALACNPTDPTNDYVYGERFTILTGLQWLSPTKLLVLLENRNKTSVQGIYIFDTSATAQPPGYWGPISPVTHMCTATQPPVGPKQTFFLNVPSLVPYAAAFKV
jgi:hypothetical protein